MQELFTPKSTLDAFIFGCMDGGSGKSIDKGAFAASWVIWLIGGWPVDCTIIIAMQETVVE